MIVGFKGDNYKLKNLYKLLGLKEVKPNNFDELVTAVKNNDGSTVILNYNEIMVFNNPTADLVEKRSSVLSEVNKSKKNIYIALTKNDPSIDKLHLDVSVCTSIDTDDMGIIEDIFSFVNTDLPYSGRLEDDEYAVRVHGELRATKKSLSELKKILK